ncbi:3-oxoacyl-reductase, partial [Ophiobolus disseminans]
MAFNGRVIAITGAASGIGLATTHLLASHGASLSLADLNTSALSTLSHTLAHTYPSLQILTYTLDVRCPLSIQKWLETTHAIFGRIDGAANLAGVIGKSIGVGGVAELDVGEWDFIFDVNLKGVMLCMKYELGYMGKGGSIVNASSVAGVMGQANNAAYAASKHGVIGLTRSVAKEVGHRGVRVNAICPGFIDTPMNKQSSALQGQVGRERQEKVIAGTALGRRGTAEECAELIVYLLGDGSSFITGAAVGVDGGWNC